MFFWNSLALEGTNSTSCTQGPRRKEQWPHKRLTQTCPWVCRSLWWRHGSVVACCRVGGTECSSAGMGRFEGGHHYPHYLHHSLASGQITGRKQPHPSTENWIKDLLSKWVSEIVQSCLTLWDPMDRSQPGSSIHGIYQARILEWVAIAFSNVELYLI